MPNTFLCSAHFFLFNPIPAFWSDRISTDVTEYLDMSKRSRQVPNLEYFLTMGVNIFVRPKMYNWA